MTLHGQGSGSARRIGRYLLRALGLALLGILVLIGLGAAALNTRWARQQLVVRVNAALADSFQGTLRLERVERVGLGGVWGVDAFVTDAARRRVIEVDNLDVGLDVLPLVWELVVVRPKDLRIRIDSAALAHARVHLIDAGGGVPTLATAFESRAPGGPSEGTVTLDLTRIELDHVWAHGNLAGTPIDADLAELRATLGVRDTAVNVELSRAKLRARALPGQPSPRGDLVGALGVPLAGSKAPLTLRARFAGDAWGSPTTLSAELRGRAIDARAVFDSVGPEQLGRVLPGSEIRGPAALRATARGTLDQPKLSAHARIGGGTLDADLALDTGARTLNAVLRSRQLNLSLLDPALPESALSVTLTASGSYTAASALTARYRVRLGDSTLGGAPLPATESEGSIELLRAAPESPVAWRVQGELGIHEPGAESVFEYAAHAAAGEQTAQVSGTTELASPARLQRLVPGLRVQGRVRSQAKLDLGSGKLSANAHASLSQLGTRGASADGLELRATAEGAFSRPELAVGAEFRRLVVAERVYRAGSLRVSGTPERLRIDARTRTPPEVALGALVTLEPDLTVSDAELLVKSGHAVQRLSATALRFEQHRITGKDLRWTTPSGAARASFEYQRGLRSLRLEAHDFDIVEAATPWGLADALPRGIVAANLRFEREPGGASGYAEVDVKHLGYGSVDEATARVSARLQRGLLAGSLDARWRDSAASVTLDELPLAALPSADARELAGRINGEVDMNLEDFEALLGPAGIPLAEAGGRAELAFRLEKRPRAPSRFEASLETSRLRLVGEREELQDATVAAARRAAPWSFTGVDVDLALVFDEATRELSLDAAFEDAKGKLAALQTQARWPGEAAGLPLVHWPALWQRAEATAHVWLLPRKLSEWPSQMQLSGIEGTASVSVHASGKLQNPRVRWMARLEDFGPPDEAREDLDLTTSGDYRTDGGTARVGVVANDRRVAEAHAQWNGDAIGRWVHGREDLTASLRGRLDRFPVAAIPLVTSQRLAGHVTGDFDVERTDTDWQGQLELASTDFSVAQIAADQLRLRANLRKGWLDASFRAGGRALGSIDAALVGWTPMAENAPRSPRLRARLRAKQFQLKSLAPLASGAVSGLEGFLNADVSGELSRDDPKLRGRVEISRGAAQLPALGQTLHSIEARVKLAQNRILLSRFDARGLTGRLRARGSATLDGLALHSAQASVDIPERDKIPLTVRGVTLGDAWGRASVEYRQRGERRQRLDVDVARFHLELPDVSPPGVQSLEPAAHVEVGHRTRAGKFVDIPLQPIEPEPTGGPERWLIAVKLGDVEVRKGPGIAIGLEGELKARIGRRTRLEGQIDLTGGTIDVRGKEFKIERGSITFDRSEVDHGVVTATARWDSPAEYTVYAEYSGTVAEGQLRLRSEPPLTQDEILGLVMFGTPGGTFGARKQDEAATAVGLAGGTVAKGLNRALSDFSSLDLSTRVDTSTGEARPELVLQVTPSVTARVTQAIGEAPPGQSPDRTFLTVDLRLFTRWSLSAQVGDEGGSSLDLIWRHRY